MLHETALIERYKAARANLWQPKPQPRPIQITQSEPVAQPVPVKPTRRELFGCPEEEMAFLRKEVGRLKRELASLRQRLDRRSDFERPVHMMDIKIACADAFRVAVRELESDGRRAGLCKARDAAAWLGAKLSKLSTSAIGEHLGGRDHSTLVVAIERCELRMNDDEGYRAAVATIYRELAKTAGAQNVEQ